MTPPGHPRCRTRFHRAQHADRAQFPLLDQVLNRRRLLGLAGASAVSAAVLGACGSGSGSGASASSKPPVSFSFRSRPDLRPRLVKVRRGPGTASPAPGYVFVTPNGPTIYDDAGQPVWTHRVPGASTDLKVQQYRGQPVLTWWEGTVTHGTGDGVGKIMDSAYTEVATVRAGNGLQADLHELVLTPAGTAYITAYREVVADLRPVGGPARGTLLDAVVQEVDVATGAVVFEWRSHEHIALTESHLTYDKSVLFDPFHLNSIEVLPDGSLLLSARNTWALYRVDRATGAIIYRLGGKASDFTLGPGVRFAWQHHARSRGAGAVTVFDDEAGPPEAKQSRGLVLNVDEVRRRVTVAKAYDHPGTPLLAASQGSVQPQANGNVVVGWGAEPYYTEFDSSGALVLDARFAAGQSYRAYRFEWTGHPAEPPAATAVRHGAGRTTVYASWNGATEVERWLVAAGSSSGHLSQVASAGRDGFETAIEVSSSPDRVQVTAVGSGGAVLASSRPVAVTS